VYTKTLEHIRHMVHLNPGNQNYAVVTSF